VIGTLVVIAVGLLAAIAISIRRGIIALQNAPIAPPAPEAERERTPFFERMFKTRAILVVVLILPVALALAFQDHRGGRPSSASLILGEVLFIYAIIGNLILIVAGLLAALGISVGRAAGAAENETTAPARGAQAAFHHPDPVRTSFMEKAFMAAATLLVLVGLPVALAVVFQLVIPMIGTTWTR
jgi:hypothetical protein